MSTDLIDKTAGEIVDMFLGDCILPSTNKKRRMKSSELYKIFEIYCEEIGIAPPNNVIGFGRCISKRLQSIRNRDGTYYFCEFRPNLFEGVDT